MCIKLISREEIIRKSLHNPILHHCIVEWGNGKISFEEAMKIAVMALVESNDMMTNQLQAQYERSGNPRMKSD